MPDTDIEASGNWFSDTTSDLFNGIKEQPLTQGGGAIAGLVGGWWASSFLRIDNPGLLGTVWNFCIGGICAVGGAILGVKIADSLDGPSGKETEDAVQAVLDAATEEARIAAFEALDDLDGRDDNLPQQLSEELLGQLRAAPGMSEAQLERLRAPAPAPTPAG